MRQVAILRPKEARALSLEELNEKLKALEAELRSEIGAVASGTAPKNPGKIREIRRTIARIKTIINEKKKEV